MQCIILVTFFINPPPNPKCSFLQITYMQLFDGHNGSAAAIYSKENLLANVLGAIPPDLNRDEWIAALPRALVAGFVKTDKDLQERGINKSMRISIVLQYNKPVQDLLDDGKNNEKRASVEDDIKLLEGNIEDYVHAM